jgi:hypothetical protein
MLAHDTMDLSVYSCISYTAYVDGAAYFPALGSAAAAQSGGLSTASLVYDCSAVHPDI